MLHTNPLMRRLLAQLAPAALVATAGVLLLGQITNAPTAGPEPKLAAEPIKAEAIFTATPRVADTLVAEQAPAAPRVIAKPKPQPRRVAAAVPAPAREPAIVAAPLPPPPEPPQAVAQSDNSMMGKLRNATAAMTQMPQRAYSTVAGWFVEGEPPRPPVAIPSAEFQSSM